MVQLLLGRFMKQLNALGNLKIDEKNQYALFSINPKIYPLELVFSAAYVLMDKAYIILDGDPKKEILVEIRKKNGVDDTLQNIVYDFNNELLNYAVYKVQSEKNKTIREIILQKILLSNDPYYYNTPVESSPKDKEIEDKKGILKKWEDSEDKIINKNIEKIKFSKNAKDPK